MRRYIVFGITVLFVWACSEKDIRTYSGERYVYFTPLEDGQDSVLYSFFNYPGQERIEARFEVNLVGEILTEDMPYRVEVVDSVTTALPSNYLLPEAVFREGRVTDTLVVVLQKTDGLKENVSIGLQIEPNAYFAQGVAGMRRLRIVLNNVPSRPLWWKGDIVRVYLGTYSAKKYQEFVLCTGVNDLTDVSASWKREYALQFKAYIAENGITEEDGTPMLVPIY